MTDVRIVVNDKNDADMIKSRENRAAIIELLYSEIHLWATIFRYGSVDEFKKDMDNFILDELKRYINWHIDAIVDSCIQINCKENESWQAYAEKRRVKREELMKNQVNGDC